MQLKRKDEVGFELIVACDKRAAALGDRGAAVEVRLASSDDSRNQLRWHRSRAVDVGLDEIAQRWPRKPPAVVSLASRRGSRFKVPDSLLWTLGAEL